MRKILPLFFLAASLAYSQAPEITVGAKWSILPTYSVKTSTTEMKFSGLNSYGLVFRVGILPSMRITSGLDLQYASKTRLAEYKPAMNTNGYDAGLGLGSSTDIRWIHADIPFLVELYSYDFFQLNGGVKLGIGNFKQTGRISFYDALSGPEVNSTEESLSKNAIVYGPVLEWGVHLSDFRGTVGIEYISCNPSFEKTIDIEPNPAIDGNNPGITATRIHTEWKWRLTGLQLGLSLAYRL